MKKDIDKEDVLHEIKSSHIIKKTENCYCYRLASLLSQSDNNDNPTRSNLILYEDGIKLRPHSLHSDIVKKGGGIYSHWHDYLLFSSSDNSNPCTNNKKYTYKISNDKKKTVFIIGSCREHLVLSPHSNNTVYDDHQLSFNSYKFWYPHYTKEIIQYIKYLKGSVEIPDVLWPVLYNYMQPRAKLSKEAVDNIAKGIINDRAKMGRDMMNADIVMIEICSMKKVPYVLNGNTYYLNLVHYGLQSPQIFNSEYLSISRGEFEADMREIQNLLKDKTIMFVTHNETANMPTRNLLIEWISEDASKLNQPVFKPHKYTQVDTAKYMADLYHYTEAGKEMLKNAFFSELKSILRIV